MTALSGSRGTGQAGQPSWWASWAVRSASLPLPSEHRYRYRQEFLAELYGMAPSEQLHHATGVLSRFWTLRVALNEPARLMPKEAIVAKLWRCRIRLHRWQRIRNPQRRLVPRMPRLRKATGLHRKSPVHGGADVRPTTTSR